MIAQRICGGPGRRLAPDFRLDKCSRLYETEPAYVLDQPRFYNQVCQATTELAPLDALHRLKAIEAELGRVASTRFGPRLIDLDLLFYDDQVLDTPELVLPHPRLAERPFVLVPLAEIAPDAEAPRAGADRSRNAGPVGRYSPDDLACGGLAHARAGPAGWQRDLRVGPPNISHGHHQHHA